MADLEHSAADAQATFAAHVFAGLRSGGVTDVVLSPGSRSTPFVLEALRLQGQGALALHTVLDERTAGFFALGLAREGRLPVCVCTSGTAAAHYLPAVVEAGASGMPLVVLSADRPPELRDTGANQTIDQTHLFGWHVEAFVDLGAPGAAPRMLRAAERRALRAAVIARRTASPVHLNAPARKPLEGTAASHPGAAAAVFDPVPTADPEGIEHLAELLGSAARPLIVAGPGPARQGRALEDVRRLVECSGALLLADATSQFAALGDPVELALRTPAGRGLVDADFVLQLGESPIGKGWSQYASGRRRWILCERGWPDPTGDADGLVFGPIAASVRVLADALERSTKPKPQHPRRERLKRVSSEAVASLPWGETRALEHIARAVDASGARLVIGNSSCVRLIDLAAAPRATVHSQRGASGIDGLIAGTCGVATASRMPTVLVLGDVSFLHDVGALQELAKLDTPTVVVVLDDGGGRIFEQLPVVDALPTAAFEAHFALAHRWALEELGTGFGIRASSIANPTELDQALSMSLEHPGASVLRVVLPTHSVRDDLAALDAFVEDALARDLPGADT